MQDPDVPIEENETCLKRTVELDQEVEATFGAQFNGIEYPRVSSAEEMHPVEKPFAALPTPPARTAGSLSRATESHETRYRWPRKKS